MKNYYVIRVNDRFVTCFIGGAPVLGLVCPYLFTNKKKAAAVVRELACLGHSARIIKK